MRVIYGASTVGKALLLYTEADAFFDNGKSGEFCGLPIIDEIPDDAEVIVAVADIADVMRPGWESAATYLRDKHFYDPFVRYAIGVCIACHDAYFEGRRMLRSVDLILTERCTLRCRDCSNLMPQYADPRDVDVAEVVLDAMRLMRSIDVYEFRVLGGEPMMHKQFAEAVSLLCRTEVKRVVVYTNGTIVPTEEQLNLMSHSKVMVLVTVYPQSRNVGRLIDGLARHGIERRPHIVSGWTSCAKVERHEPNDNFEKCCAKNTYTLSDGKLYRCPFAANAERATLIPETSGVPLDAIEPLLSATHTDACDWCPGRPFGAPEIVPAIQKGV